MGTPRVRFAEDIRQSQVVDLRRVKTGRGGPLGAAFKHSGPWVHRHNTGSVNQQRTQTASAETLSNRSTMYGWIDFKRFPTDLETG